MHILLNTWKVPKSDPFLFLFVRPCCVFSCDCTTLVSTWSGNHRADTWSFCSCVFLLCVPSDYPDKESDIHIDHKDIWSLHVEIVCGLWGNFSCMRQNHIHHKDTKYLRELIEYESSVLPFVLLDNHIDYTYA